MSVCSVLSTLNILQSRSTAVELKGSLKAGKVSFELRKTICWGNTGFRL